MDTQIVMPFWNDVIDKKVARSKDLAEARRKKWIEEHVTMNHLVSSYPEADFSDVKKC
jgi:hypothetical protein